jgi:hypothetical protein
VKSSASMSTFPVDLLNAIDREARRIGVSRQAFITLRLADTLARSRLRNSGSDLPADRFLRGTLRAPRPVSAAVLPRL